MKKSQRHFIETALLIIPIIITVSCLKVAEKGCDEPAPETITAPASFITSDGAVINGRVTAHGQKTDLVFETGINDRYGTSVKPLDEAVTEVSTRAVSVQLSSLSPGTTYHFRLKATGKCRESAGDDLTFTTLNTGETGIIFNPDLSYGTVTDVDDYSYKTIKIGDQTWMAENLRTARLNDSTNIQMDINNYTWTTRTSPAYSIYNSFIQLKNSAGYLYNWYTVSTGKLCPAGWHVPGDSEWSVLINYLGGESLAGNKLKMAGTGLWIPPNQGATNESGFTAIPGGIRYGRIDAKSGLFYNLGSDTYFWTSTQASTTTAKYRQIDKNGVIAGTATNAGKYPLNNKNFGFSVRCIKN